MKLLFLATLLALVPMISHADMDESDKEFIQGIGKANLGSVACHVDQCASWTELGQSCSDLLNKNFMLTTYPLNDQEDQIIGLDMPSLQAAFRFVSSFNFVPIFWEKISDRDSVQISEPLRSDFGVAWEFDYDPASMRFTRFHYLDTYSKNDFSCAVVN